MTDIANINGAAAGAAGIAPNRQASSVEQIAAAVRTTPAGPQDADQVQLRGTEDPTRRVSSVSVSDEARQRLAAEGSVQQSGQPAAEAGQQGLVSGNRLQQQINALLGEQASAPPAPVSVSGAPGEDQRGADVADVGASSSTGAASTQARLSETIEQRLQQSEQNRAPSPENSSDLGDVPLRSESA